VRLFFDEEPPSPEILTAMLHLLHGQTEQVLPGAVPVLVDVRRGVSHHQPIRTSAEDVRRWLDGEGAGFRAMWKAA
jgi:hypothetical protein